MKINGSINDSQIYCNILLLGQVNEKDFTTETFHATPYTPNEENILQINGTMSKLHFKSMENILSTIIFKNSGIYI